MSKDRRSKVDGDILDEVLKNNGTRTNRNGDLKGLQQFQTPIDLAEELVDRLNIHPGQTVYDPQCSHGNLLHSAPYSSAKFGVELDTSCVPSGIHMAHGATAKFDEAMRNIIDPEWRVDFAVANPPFGFRWDGRDSTEWTLLHCIHHANAGLLIGNASTIERLEMHTWGEITHYETRDTVWQGVEVQIGILFWKSLNPRVATRPHDLAAKFDLVAEILQEERSHRKWNFWLDHLGRLRTYLSTRLKLTQKITPETARNLLALEGQSPMSLAGDIKARRVMQSMVEAGYYTIEPECQAEIERAIEESQRAEVPIMPVTDFELVAYAETEGHLTCNKDGSLRVERNEKDLPEATKRKIDSLERLIKDPAATTGEIEGARQAIRKLKTIRLDNCFTPGKRYTVDSETYEFAEKFTREKVHLHEESLRTYTMSHDCKLTGRERKVIIRDNTGDFHEFLDRPDKDAPTQKQINGQKYAVHTHPESELWDIFERPTVQTVAERFPDRIAHHNEVMDMMEASADFTFKPGQRDYLARFACKDFGLPAAETGVGKTLLAIATAAMKGAKRPLVIAPQGTMRDSVDDEGQTCTAQWVAEIHRFAPWIDLYVFTDEDELNAHRRSDGTLPKGFYITYYEAMFNNKSREFAPKTWKSKHLYPMVGRKYEPRMVEKKDLMGQSYLEDANDHDEWIQGMGECGRLHKDKPYESKAEGIKCLAKPCLAELHDHEFDMVIADEFHKACFPPSTRVTTDRGELSIGEIVQKQLDCSVLSCNIKTQLTEWKPVLDWITIETQQPLVKITHETGSFICTADHEIYTEKGKRPAASLRPGEAVRALPQHLLHSKEREKYSSVLLSEVRDTSERTEGVDHEAVRRLRQGLHDRPEGAGHAEVLLSGLCKQKESSAKGDSILPGVWEELRNTPAPEPNMVQRFLPQEAKEPYLHAGSHAKNLSLDDWQETTPPERGERENHDPAGNAGNRTQSPNGVSDPNGAVERAEHTGQLQSRHSRPFDKTSDRSGWPVPQNQKDKSFRSKEGANLSLARVVSVEILERRDTERLTQGDGEDRIVYCLEVEGNHNFFADGALVSNCNLNAQLTDALIRMQPRYRYGFTATPIPNKASNLFSLLGWLCVPEWYKGGRCNAAFPYRREDMGRFCENFLSNERDLTAEDIARELNKSKPKPKSSPILSSPARLLKLIKPTMAYISKPDCDPDYTRPEIVDVRVPMGMQQGKLYAHFMNRGNILHKNGMTRAGVQLAVLRSICAEPVSSKYNGERASKHKCAPCKDTVTSPYNPKLQTILSLCRDIFDEGRQVVIVNSRVGLTDCIATRLAQCGVEYSRIDSTVSPKNASAEASRFKAGRSRVMLMGIKCAQSYSFGQCDRLIIGSLEYSYGSFEQAKGRIDRITSRGTKIYCVLTQNSIEDTVFDSVATKQDSAAICLQGKRVPRSFKPVDMGELLAESMKRFNSGGDNDPGAPRFLDETEQLKHWPTLRAEITNAYNGINTTAKIA